MECLDLLVAMLIAYLIISISANAGMTIAIKKANQNKKDITQYEMVSFLIILGDNFPPLDLYFSS